MGMAGTVASNEAVSNWTDSYRPYYAPSAGGGGGGGGAKGTAGSAVGQGGGSAYSVAGLYEAIERARLQAFEAARLQNENRLNAQKNQIEGQYIEGRTRAQTDARLTAQGREEKLAALGLNAGGSYEAPTAGYAETSRIAADNRLKSDLNALSAAKQTALSQADSAAAAADTTLLTENAQGAAEAAKALADVALREQTGARDYALQSAAVTGYLNGAPTLAYRQYQAGLAQDMRALAAKAEQTNYENALTRWKTYGYVLPADAAVLGVPAGTGSADARYQEAALRLNTLKTAYQTSK